MRRYVVWGFLFCLLPACAVAFTPGLDPAPAPSSFPDPIKPASAEEKLVEAATVSSMPAVGMSLVVGGEPMDAGHLPKSPIPVVLLP